MKNENTFPALITGIMLLILVTIAWNSWQSRQAIGLFEEKIGLQQQYAEQIVQNANNVQTIINYINSLQKSQ